MHGHNSSPTYNLNTYAYSILRVAFNAALVTLSIPMYSTALPAANEPEWKKYSKDPIWPKDIPEFYGTLGFPVESYTDISRRFPKVRGIYIDSMHPRCVKKSVGAADGWVCKLDRDNKTTTYYLKATDKDSYMRLNEVVYLQYASSVGVKVPNVGYMVHLNNIYIASEQVAGFETAGNLFHESRKTKKDKPLPPNVTISYFQHEFTRMLREKLCPEGFVQLSAFKTIITDLTNADNWGYDHNGNLVLIDIDQAPKERARFFYEAARGLDYTRGLAKGSRDSKMFANFDITLDEIVELKQFFIKMHETPFPKLFNVLSKNKQNGFSHNLYLVLTAYIAACNEAIETLGNLTPEALALTSPNNILAQNILKFINFELEILNFRDLAKPTPFEERHYPHIVATLTEAYVEPELDGDTELQMRKHLEKQQELGFNIHKSLFLVAPEAKTETKVEVKTELVTSISSQVTPHAIDKKSGRTAIHDMNFMLWMGVLGTSGGLLLLLICKELKNYLPSLQASKNHAFFRQPKKHYNTPAMTPKTSNNLYRV